MFDLNDLGPPALRKVCFLLRPVTGCWVPASLDWSFDMTLDRVLVKPIFLDRLTALFRSTDSSLGLIDSRLGGTRSGLGLAPLTSGKTEFDLWSRELLGVVFVLLLVIGRLEDIPICALSVSISNI